MSIRASVSLTLNFDKITSSVLAAAQLGVARAGEELLKEAVGRAPMDENTQRNSAAVSMPLAARGGDPQVDVSFDTPYAARLHEHPEYNFSRKSNANAQGKYLENAAMENRDLLGEIIAEQIQKGSL